MIETTVLSQPTKIADAAEVRSAVQAFARALTETAQFKAFEQTSEALDKDLVAQQVITAYQTKQQSLQMMLRLNAVSADERAELDRLQQTFLTQPTVAAYLQAQNDMMVLFHATADLISERLGLNFATSGSGCC